MKLFEVQKGVFINMDNVFKFELVKLENSDSVFWRFWSENDQSVNSKEFTDDFDALTWLNMTIARSEGADEVIML